MRTSQLATSIFLVACFIAPGSGLKQWTLVSSSWAFWFLALSLVCHATVVMLRNEAIWRCFFTVEENQLMRYTRRAWRTYFTKSMPLSSTQTLASPVAYNSSSTQTESGPSFLLTEAAERLAPPEWTHRPEDDEARTYEWWRRWRYEAVDLGSSEGSDVAVRLYESMQGVEVVRIHRVQHRLFWRRFEERRAELQDKVGGDGNVHGHGMWHGTGSTPPETILDSEQGLDPRLSRPDGFYGSAIYLAERACYSNNAKYSHAGTDCRTLLLVRAACGEVKQLGEDIKRNLDPARDLVVQAASSTARPRCFDAVRGGPHRPLMSGPGEEDSPIYALYSSASIYPEYAVTYKLRLKLRLKLRWPYTTASTPHADMLGVFTRDIEVINGKPLYVNGDGIPKTAIWWTPPDRGYRTGMWLVGLYEKRGQDVAYHFRAAFTASLEQEPADVWQTIVPTTKLLQKTRIDIIVVRPSL